MMKEIPKTCFFPSRSPTNLQTFSVAASLLKLDAQRQNPRQSHKWMVEPGDPLVAKELANVNLRDDAEPDDPEQQGLQNGAQRKEPSALLLLLRDR